MDLYKFTTNQTAFCPNVEMVCFLLVTPIKHANNFHCYANDLRVCVSARLNVLARVSRLENTFNTEMLEIKSVSVTVSRLTANRLSKILATDLPFY